MADYDNRILRGQSDALAGASVDAGLRAYMLKVYNYMVIGLGLTGVTAYITANTALRDLFFAQAANGSFGLTMIGMVAIIAPIALVFLLGFRVHKMSVGAAQATFWGYAALVGISVASLLLNFTGESVARVFFITAGTFGAMSLWGYTTKRDLTGMGSFLFMGLIGIIIASLVNIFLASSMVSFVVSVLGVIIFTGLTAYDTQRIKNEYYVHDDGTVASKKAIMGALSLYLDFINLFFMLVQLLGDRR